ncbi:hypothetical protein [Streptomyces sp. NPDC088258]|uniref:hypothetical protein n=1 Tax=Streptomyces sp. NPDC088258 TaxID=3365849 RepID=UPI003826B1FC
MSEISGRPRPVRLAACVLGLALAAIGTAGTAGVAVADSAGTAGSGPDFGFGPAPTGDRTVQPLKKACATGRPQDLCRNIGVTEGWYEGSTVTFLYTQNFYCDPSVPSGAASKCEAGTKANRVPPGTTSERFTDPLYIPVPLFSPGPAALQCPANEPCVDHPTSIDLSALSAALKTPAAKLKNTMLPGHDHIIADRNKNRPEWWPVKVVAVSDPDSYAKIQAGKDLATVTKLAADPNSGVSRPIDTNVFLWFQTLPGTDRAGAASDDGGASKDGTTPPAARDGLPKGGVAAGTGSTQGLQHPVLIGAGGALLAGAAGALVLRRRKGMGDEG